MYIRSSIEGEVIYVCVRGPLPGIWRGIHMVRGCMRWLEDDGPGVGIRCGRLAIQGQWTAARPWYWYGASRWCPYLGPSFMGEDEGDTLGSWVRVGRKV